MSNPYGWSPSTDGQPAVYFAPPEQQVPIPAASGAGRAPYTNGTSNAPYAGYSNAPYGNTTRNAPHGNGYSKAPYDKGYGAYPSFMDQYAYEPPPNDPFASTSAFKTLSAQGARQKVTMTEAMILWLRNWRNFSGRASRSEYWWIRVVEFVGQVVWWFLLFGVVEMGQLSPTDPVVNLVLTIVLLVTSLVALVLWIPTLSLTVRRLHDTDRSGWYVMLRYVPFGSWMLFRALRQSPDPAGFRFDDSTNRPYGVEDID